MSFDFPEELLASLEQTELAALGAEQSIRRGLRDFARAIRDSHGNTPEAKAARRERFRLRRMLHKSTMLAALAAKNLDEHNKDMGFVKQEEAPDLDLGELAQRFWDATARFCKVIDEANAALADEGAFARSKTNG